jgi:hypothetical protein
MTPEQDEPTYDYQLRKQVEWLEQQMKRLKKVLGGLSWDDPETHAFFDEEFK